LGNSSIKSPPDLQYSSNKRDSNEYSHCSISIKISDVLKKGAEVEQTEPNLLGNTKSTIQSMFSGPSLNKFAL
jgi:chemotaxis receptor (MCP) glutamine deamidase CheD